MRKHKSGKKILYEKYRENHTKEKKAFKFLLKGLNALFIVAIVIVILSLSSIGILTLLNEQSRQIVCYMIMDQFGGMIPW